MTPSAEPSRRDIVPEHWADFFRGAAIPAAVVVGDELRLTGHTGESERGELSLDPPTQLRQTFVNIGATLDAAGFAWGDVIELTSYHVGLSGQRAVLLDIAGEFLPKPFPAWTAVGVTELFVDEAVVEISCVARRPGRRAAAAE